MPTVDRHPVSPPHQDLVDHARSLFADLQERDPACVERLRQSIPTALGIMLSEVPPPKGTVEGFIPILERERDRVDLLLEARRLLIEFEQAAPTRFHEWAAARPHVIEQIESGEATKDDLGGFTALLRHRIDAAEHSEQ